MSYSDLPPFPGKICCCKLFKRSKNEKIAEDHRLVNWRKWMEERKQVNQTMGKALERHTEQLLSNFSEDLSAINQEKKVLESTNIIYPHDHYRGNPAFWRMPVALGKKPCQPCRPDYFSVMTDAQKCQIPNMEYVNVPDIVRKEKDSLTIGYRGDKKVWDASEYRKARTEELDVKIKIVEPYKPDLGQLFIKGVGIKSKPAENEEKRIEDVFPQVPSVALSIDPSPPTEIPEIDDFLQINDHRLCAQTTDDINVYLHFQYNISKDDLSTDTFSMHNGTPYALRYYLTPKKKFYLFRDIVKDTEDEEVFFYDKRELVMLPSKSFELPISFKTDFPSTYKLQLTFNIRPKLWNCTIILNLMAVATYEDLPERCENIKKRLEMDACELIVRDTIQDILEGIPPQVSSPPTFYIYDKATIFESINQDFAPNIRRPKYVYDKEVVEELEEFYAKVRLKDSPPIWNLCIKDLREVTQRKQQEEYRKHFLEELIVVKDKESKASSVPESRSPVKTADSSKHSRSKLQTINVEEHKTFGYNYVEELEDILIKLKQPSTWINENKTLFESCYSVMCTYFDALISEVMKLEFDLNIVKHDRYPAQYTYDPNKFRDRLEEIHEELAGQPPRIKEDFVRESNPLAECLKDIPFNESDARYKTYYGIVDEPLIKEKKGKGKKGKKDKGNAKDKKGKKGKGKKEKAEEKPIAKAAPIPDINLNENPDFNLSEVPQLERICSVKLTTSSDGDVSSGLTSGLLLQEYKRGLYDIFYRNLSEAAVKLVDVIELHKRDKVRLENIKRMLVETSSKQRPVQMRVVDLKEAIRLAMNLPMKYRPAYSQVCEKPSELQIKFAEGAYAKEEGSQWSILEPLKMPDSSDKPISYPETNVYLKKRMSKRMAQDVGTIMSNAGIDPNWTDYKDVDVQIISKWEGRAEKEEFMYNMVGKVLDDICLEEVAARQAVGEDEEEDGVSELSTLFYSESDLTNIPDKRVCEEESSEDAKI